jgi:hypothetical protein
MACSPDFVQYIIDQCSGAEPGRAVLKEVILRPPYEGAKDYFYISYVDDREYLTSLIRVTIPALPKLKLKNPLK